MQLSWKISFIMWTEGPKLKDASSISKHYGIEFSPAEVAIYSLSICCIRFISSAVKLGIYIWGPYNIYIYIYI